MGDFMNLYNTLTKKVEKFTSIEKNKVKIYTCGPTVYNYVHIGNLRTYIFEDILQKGFEYLGYDVKRVMNITDVGHLTSDADYGEDKMTKGAKREGKTVYEIADFYTKAFFKDMEKLNIKKPKIIEKASDHIDMYIKMIEKMLKEGYAYESNGNVYFDVTKAKDYYKLSGRNPKDLMVAVREDVEADQNKKNFGDFGLWFTLSKFQNQAMKWDSPWGVGYPGWHIECSGLACLYLGDRIDIHCGGVDNIFPHHTNEIAQSEAYLGHKWCNYWCHGEFLNDKSGKMSKSKGGILTINRLIEEGYNPLSYRYFCLGSHYRKPLVFTYESLDIAQNAYQKLLQKTKKLKKEGNFDQEIFNTYQTKFKEAIEDDLNTSMMLTILYEVLNNKDINDTTKREIIKSFDTVLSLNLLEETKIDDEKKIYIEEQIKKRNEAKKNRDYQTADKIRDELLKENIRLLDTREGTKFEII